MNLPIELKTRIYSHLGTVERHLNELPADEQRDILQTLETHIYDALESRSDGQPTEELLEAILAEMDPPESYGNDTSLFSPQNSRSLSPGLKIGFFVLIGALTFLFAFLWINDPFSSHWMSQEPATPNQFVREGSGSKDFVIGMSREELVSKHGAPQANHPDWLMRWDSEPFIDVVINDEGICRELRFNQGFTGETTSGIKLGSSFEEACTAYGQAERVWTRDACVIGEWSSKGLALWTADGKVTQIIVRNPCPLAQPPFKDDSSVIGRWISIDFVQDIDQFNPGSRNWKGDLFLKELTFLPGGESPTYWKWTNGFIITKNAWSRYELKTIGSQTYLFSEWMSGDVTLRGQRPRYYVFTRE